MVYLLVRNPDPIDMLFDNSEGLLSDLTGGNLR